MSGEEMPNSRINKYNLTDQQILFCHEYIKENFNATQAAINAGYSEKTARYQASDILTRLNIQQYIGDLKEKMLKKVDVTPERILKEKARIAFLDPRKLFTEDGSLKPIHELDEDVAAAIASIEITKDGLKILEIK